MLGAIVFAAAVTVSSQFLADFKGTWNCGGSTWTIASAPGNSAWATVTYGKGDTIWGTAYVGWVEQQRRYIYRDFHNDGAVAELSSPAPGADHTWVWTGTYYPMGQPADPNPHITWTYQPPNTIVRHFAKQQDGQFVDMGSDRCTRS